ncbi:hypothetical protein Mgra_00001475, partial [Meloidogyne graminicola]
FRLKKKETINENSTINKEWKEKSEQNKKRKKAIIKQQQQLSVDWQLPTPETPKKLEEIQLINLHADINFLANQTVIHKRTPIYLLEYNECLEVYFRIEGKRTRLLLYTCHMFEGGVCVLSKFLATTSNKYSRTEQKQELDFCFKMQPWMGIKSPFAFHIRFVRRPRKFMELRHLQRRNGWHSKREKGRIKLFGFHPCEMACNQSNINTELNKIQPHFIQNRHEEDYLEGY